MRQMITKTSEGRDAKFAVKVQPKKFEVVYETSTPGGPFGYYGPNVCAGQSVAVRFELTSGHYLKKLALWFMNNGQPNVPEVSVTLRNDKTDGNVSIPGDEILERLQFKVSAVGWDPVLEELDSKASPYLEAATKYWVVAESEVRCGEDGVWVMAGHGTGFSSSTHDGKWQPGGEGAVPASIVWGIPPVE